MNPNLIVCPMFPWDGSSLMRKRRPVGVERIYFISHSRALGLVTQAQKNRQQHAQMLPPGTGRESSALRTRCFHWGPRHIHTLRDPRTPVGNDHFEIIFLCSNVVYACLCCEGKPPTVLYVSEPPGVGIDI